MYIETDAAKLIKSKLESNDFTLTLQLIKDTTLEDIFMIEENILFNDHPKVTFMRRIRMLRQTYLLHGDVQVESGIEFLQNSPIEIYKTKGEPKSPLVVLADIIK